MHQVSIADIVGYLLNNEEELLQIFYGNSCLLHIDKEDASVLVKTLVTSSS